MIDTFKSMIKVAVFLTFVFYTGGCGDRYETSLTVYPDGTFEKSVEWTTSSNNPETDEPVFPLSIDSSWTITSKGKTTRKTAFGSQREVWTFQASKKFKSVEELNKEYITDQKIRLSPRAEFQKRFKGIFTTYIFKETYPTVYLFNKIPVSEFFSPEEMKLIKTMLEDEDGLDGKITEEEKKEIEKKSETWMRRSLFEAFFSLLLEETGKLDEGSISREMLVTQKEQMFSHFSRLNKEEMFKVSVKDFLEEYEKIQGNPGFSLLWTKGKSTFIQFENELKAIDEVILDSYINHITMPGIIASTNAPSMTGNTVSWEVPFLMLLFRDMVMEVESRQINWWFIGLGAPLLILILIGLVSAIRQKKLR